MTFAPRFALAAVSVAVLAASADARIIQNSVLPLNNTTFEVIGDRSSAAKDYWCSAGDFAISQLRTSAAQRIYVVRTLAPSENVGGQKSVIFSLTPPEGVDTTPGFNVTVKTLGDNMNASMARNYCFTDILDF